MDVSQILDLIPITRGRPREVTPLSGGMTNENFQITMGDGDRQCYVLRVWGANTAGLGIDRASEEACSRAAATLGLAPPIVASVPEAGAVLRPFVTGLPLTPEQVRQPDTLGRVLTALRRYHGSAPGAGHFCAFATIRSYYELARARGVKFPDAISRAFQFLARIEAEIPPGETRCPCHNDLLAANFIDGPSGLSVIDWEYAGMGDRFFDLGNLAVNNAFRVEDEQLLLQLYFGRVHESHLRRLQQMRLVSDLREALWGYLQSGLSAIEMDFTAYGERHLNRFLKGATALQGE